MGITTETVPRLLKKEVDVCLKCDREECINCFGRPAEKRKRDRKEYQKEYVNRNKERIQVYNKEYKRRYKERCKDKISEYQREYREKAKVEYLKRHGRVDKCEK